ncbi:hypothetical protein V8E55_001022, partial [Tylopilus felleus]
MFPFVSSFFSSFPFLVSFLVSPLFPCFLLPVSRFSLHKTKKSTKNQKIMKTRKRKSSRLSIKFQLSSLLWIR